MKHIITLLLFLNLGACVTTKPKKDTNQQVSNIDTNRQIANKKETISREEAMQAFTTSLECIDYMHYYGNLIQLYGNKWEAENNPDKKKDIQNKYFKKFDELKSKHTECANALDVTDLDYVDKIQIVLLRIKSILQESYNILNKYRSILSEEEIDKASGLFKTSGEK